MSSLSPLFDALKRRRSAAEWTAIALAVFGAVATFVAYRDYVMEDAYITYRYAQNLAAGNGFVFNPGERVLGTSTPLYTMVLALAGLLRLDIVLTSSVLFSVSLAVTGLLGAAILRRYGHPGLSILFATLAIWGACDIDFFFGMETPFYLMLLFLGYRAALDERRTATGLLVGLAFLTRYDAVVFAVSLFLVLTWKRRRIPWREGLLALGVVLPWLLFAQIYFGSVFPNTLAAKTGEVKAVDYMQESVVRQIYSFLSPFFHFWPIYLVPKIVVSLLILCLVGPIFAASRRLFARERLLAHLLLFPVLLWLGYSSIAPPIDHYWYLMPATYFLLLLALLSWGEVVRREDRVAPVRSSMGRALRAAPVGVLALLTLVFLPQKLREHAERWMVSSFYRARTDVYRTLARWIKDVGITDVSVMMHEPGYFAYWSGSPMIDAAGLITKGIYYHGPEQRRTKPDEIVRAHRPGMIVTPPLYWIGLDVSDFVPVYHPVPARMLYMRRSIFAERFEDLSRHWLAREPYHPDRPALLHHPLQWDFERGVDSGWVTGGSIGDFVGRPQRPVRYERKPVAEDYLNTDGPRNMWATVSSPPFVIDFDEIAFRFAGTHHLYTRARFIVDGQVVLEQGGDSKRGLHMFDVVWPVWSWKGKVGVLQFDDADIDGGILVADHVQTVRYERFDKVDDFEGASGKGAGGYGPFWQSGFGAGPADLEPLAVERGLAMLVGRRAALSRGAGATEKVEMLSRPFVIDHDRLSLLAFDFGGAGTRLELRVDGEVKRSWSSGGTQRLEAVIWGLRALRGQEAVLAVIDETPGDAEWIGIDDVALFDPGDGSAEAGEATATAH